MRIEYFASGGLDCPLILLYGDDPGDAEVLRDAIERLASGQIAQVAIHELPGFESVENCRLIARVSRSDAGIQQSRDGLTFVCSSQSATWLDVVGLLEPFTLRDETPAVRFQYLNETGEISLLISTARAW